MLQALLSTEEVIKALGGTSAVARLTKSKPSAVSSWKKNEHSRIPSKYYPLIQAALAERHYAPAIHLFSFDFQKSA